MSKSSRIKAFTKCLTVLIIVLLIIGVIGAVFAFTNGFQADFAVMFNGKNIANKSTVRLALGESNIFDVNALTESTCDVKIIAKASKDFEFLVDGVSHKYSKVGDLTNCFDLNVTDSSIVIVLSQHESIQTILSRKYSGSTIFVPTDKILEIDCFQMQITIADGSKVFVNFSFDNMQIDNPIPDGGMVDEIEIDKSEVVV